MASSTLHPAAANRGHAAKRFVLLGISLAVLSEGMNAWGARIRERKWMWLKAKPSGHRNCPCRSRWPHFNQPKKSPGCFSCTPGWSALGCCYWWKQHEFPWQVTLGTWGHSQDLVRLHCYCQTATIAKIAQGMTWNIPVRIFVSLKFFTMRFPQCRKIYSLLPEEGINKNSAPGIVLGLCGMTKRQEKIINDNFI